jgi:hypothetical protein
MINKNAEEDNKMNVFSEALISRNKSENIPEDQNLFGQFVGEWDFEWIDHHGSDEERHIKGEWIFSWVLEGAAIQDIFICPSRIEKKDNYQSDSEYGTTIRIYNPKTHTWDVFYGCTGEATRLEACKEDNEIVLTEIKERKTKWVFSEITEKTFHWSRISTSDGGTTWQLGAELFATRK